MAFKHILTHLALICACVHILGCVHAPSRRNDEARLQHKVGIGHLESGNLPAAFQALMTAEKLDPRDPAIQNSLGVAYFQREKFEIAEIHFKRALTLKADFSDAKNNLARTWIEMNRFDEATKLLVEVLDDMTYPTPERPLLNLGLAFFKQKQYRSALESFQKALKVNREDCPANNFVGRTLYELQQYPSAAAALDRAVLYCQRVQNDEPHYYSALAYYQAGDHQRAFARLEELIKLYPNGAYTAQAHKLLKELRK